jgi:hypothetical protein
MYERVKSKEKFFLRSCALNSYFGLTVTTYAYILNHWLRYWGGGGSGAAAASRSRAQGTET